MSRVSTFRPGVLALAFVVAGCGGADHPPAERAPAGQASGTLSAFQQEHGIGPVTEPVAVGPFDPALAVRGDTVFLAKCTACHKLEERYVGPALGGVTARRSPAYIMNMILNPQEMYERHPEAKTLLAEYLTYMPNQGLTRDDARAVLEYLRRVDGAGQ